MFLIILIVLIVLLAVYPRWSSYQYWRQLGVPQFYYPERFSVVTGHFSTVEERQAIANKFIDRDGLRDKHPTAIAFIDQLMTVGHCIDDPNTDLATFQFVHYGFSNLMTGTNFS